MLNILTGKADLLFECCFIVIGALYFELKLGSRVFILEIIFLIIEELARWHSVHGDVAMRRSELFRHICLWLRLSVLR